TQWWAIPFYLEATNMHFQTVIYDQVLDNRGTYYAATITNQFQMGKGWSSELNGTYQSSIYYAQFITKAFGRVRVGIQKKLLKNQATHKMVLNDAFWTVRPGGD
ncbi:MAG: outer membrane beta-barrel protein, partial [Flammeovirgaceae bacterium]